MLLQRLFVGNLPETVTPAEVSSKFSGFGQIEAVDVKSKNGATFAFINLNFEDESFVRQCIDVLNNTQWKGNFIKVQPAKESFLDKLKREQEESRKIADGAPPKLLLPPLAERLATASKPPGASPSKARSTPTIKQRRKKESDSDDSDGDEVHPFPAFKGINSYPELSADASHQEESTNKQIEQGTANAASISQRFQAIAVTPVKQPEAPKVDLSKCDNLQSKLLAIAGQQQHQNRQQPITIPEKLPKRDRFNNNNTNNKFRNNEAHSFNSNFNKNEIQSDNSKFGNTGNQSNNSFQSKTPEAEPPQANLIAKATPLNFRKKNSDAVRQKSLQNRWNQMQNQSNIISSSLANVLPPVSYTTDKEEAQKKSKSLSNALFEGGDDGDDEDLSFRVRPQFEGAAGEKNLELSSKFASYDSRFTLDERFREDGNNQANDEAIFEQEKQANFAILSDILGTTVAPKLRPKVQQSVIIPRYNPDVGDSGFDAKKHIKSSDSKNVSWDPKPKTETPTAESLRTTEKLSYQVSSDLKQLFTSESSGGFSLLQTFRGASQDENPTMNNNDEPFVKRSKTENKFWNSKNPFKYDSSDDEGEGELKSRQEETFKINKESFFFKKKDKRFEGLEDFFLRSEEKLDDVLYRFNNGERAELKLICRGKIKNTKRKSEKRMATLHRLKRKMKTDRGLKNRPQGSNAVPLGIKESSSNSVPLGGRSNNSDSLGTGNAGPGAPRTGRRHPKYTGAGAAGGRKTFQSFKGKGFKPRGGNAAPMGNGNAKTKPGFNNFNNKSTTAGKEKFSLGVQRIVPSKLT